MSEKEAIEFRVAELHQTVQASIVIILYVAGLVMIVASIVSTAFSLLYFGMAVGAFVAATVKAVKIAGRNKRGYFREAGKMLGENYEDPPFDEWYESLEEKNAFPVDGEAND